MIELKKRAKRRNDPFRGVGKWKIRKKISGGADAHLFTIKNGEPSSKQSYENFAQRSYRTDQESSTLAESDQGSSTLRESEGSLAFINPPDPDNPNDHNKEYCALGRNQCYETTQRKVLDFSEIVVGTEHMSISAMDFGNEEQENE